MEVRLQTPRPPLERAQCPLPRRGTKPFHRHVVGNLELAYESVDMISEHGLIMVIYAAEPGSPTEHALAMLASWAASPTLLVEEGQR